METILHFFSGKRRPLLEPETPFRAQILIHFILYKNCLAYSQINMVFVIIKLLVERQLVTVFLNHLSLVNQGTHEYMGCGRFSCFAC